MPRPRPQPRAAFVTIEGPDGSGKTTLVEALAEHYRKLSVPVTTFREPGGTALAERVRQVLLNEHAPVSPRAELFLYLAARAQLIDEVLTPALKKPGLILGDRFSLSTLAYQIGGRGLDPRAVIAADRFARDGVEPDLTVVLDVPLSVAARRMTRDGGHPDRIERENARFFRAVRAEYLRRAKTAKRIKLIDSRIGIEAVHDAARRVIDTLLTRRGIAIDG